MASTAEREQVAAHDFGPARDRRILGVNREPEIDDAVAEAGASDGAGATGTVVVRWFDVDGSPLDPRYLYDRKVRAFECVECPDDSDPISVREFYLVEEIQRSCDERVDPGHGRIAELDLHGVAEFRDVALGRFFVVHRPSPGDLGTTSEGPHQVVVQGPTRDRPHVTIDLRRERGAVVTGRFLDSDGRPVAGPLEVFCVGPRLWQRYLSVAAKDGRFRVYLGTWVTKQAVRMTVRLQSSDPESDRAEPMEIELSPRRYPEGVLDLGALELAEPRILATGYLVPERGAPTEGWSPDVLRVVANRWCNQPGISVGWEGSRFSVRGSAPDGTRLRLDFTRGGYVDPSVAPRLVEFAAGERDVEVRVPPSGTLTASFVLGEHTHTSDFEFFLEREGDLDIALDEDDALESCREPDGITCYSWDRLVPGIYRLRVEHWEGPGPVVDVKRIVIATGVPVVDPRLVKIDLRGLSERDG